MPKRKRVDHKTPLNTLVRFDAQQMEEKYRKKYPFKDQEVLLFLGEIRHMPGHCVVVKKNGRVLWGYHSESFVVIPKDEV